MLNRGDNYIQPHWQELKQDNIIDICGNICIVEQAHETHLEAYGIQERIIYEYPYKWVYGLDLKRWITNRDVLRVIDALLLANGFIKENSFANVCYTKDGFVIKSGHKDGWTINDKPISFLHELQNEYAAMNGQPLSVGARVY